MRIPLNSVHSVRGVYVDRFPSLTYDINLDSTLFARRMVRNKDSVESFRMPGLQPICCTHYWYETSMPNRIRPSQLFDIGKRKEATGNSTRADARRQWKQVLDKISHLPPDMSSRGTVGRHASIGRIMNQFSNRLGNLMLLGQRRGMRLQEAHDYHVRTESIMRRNAINDILR